MVEAARYGDLEALCGGLREEAAAFRPEGWIDRLGFVGFVELWNRIQGQGTPALHRRIAGWLEERLRAGDRRLLLMVFRNAGKSTLVGLYCAWRLARDPALRILVLSAEQGLAVRMTRNVRAVIERHPLTRHLRPAAPGSWAQDRLTVRRPVELRDPSLVARGLAGNITGARADLIVCDDVEVPNSCDTPAKRAELRERLKELPFVLTPGGTLLFVGTPHHYHSIYADRPRPECGEQRPFLEGYRRLVLPILDERGQSAWPERFPEEEIARIRAESGPLAFKSQMLLEPVPPHEIRLDPELLRVYREEIDLSEANRRPLLRIGERVMVSASCVWDPALARPEGGDASVVAVVFADGEGNLYLHDIRYLDPARDPGEDGATVMCRQVAEFVARNAIPAVAVEVTGLGRFLPVLLRRELAARGLQAAVVEHHSTTSKERRILEAFDPLLQAGRLFVHERVMETPFVAEMREFHPGGRNRDDGLDAVAMCLMREPVRIGAVPRPRGPDWRAHGRAYRARTVLDR